MNNDTTINTKNTDAVEWAPFVKQAGVSDDALIEAANEVNERFLAQQPGYIKRELVKKDESQYADIIHWRSVADAEGIAKKVTEQSVCQSYFELMDMEASAMAGAGFSHYTILKRWE